MGRQEPVTNLFDAVKQIFVDPKLLSLYGLTFVVALLLPFLVSVVLRKWNVYKHKVQTHRNLPKTDEIADEQIELPNGMSGSFNKLLMNSFRHNVEKSANLHCGNAKENPFVSRNDLVLITEEEANAVCDQQQEESTSGNLEKDDENEKIINGDEEEMPLLEDVPPREGKPKKNEKKRKQRKQLKDPDPETAEALNKLVEKGLHGKLATAHLRVKAQMLEENMTEEERVKEQQVRSKQLADIFAMMEAQKEKFGIEGKEEVVEQMKLYAL